VDRSGNVFVLGGSITPGSAGTAVFSYVTIKYSSALLQLAINRTVTNTVVVSWPSASSGFILQENTNLNNALNWSSVSAGIVDDGTTKRLIVNPVAGNRFYRLNKP
jgi:hypothetical protein